MRCSVLVAVYNNVPVVRPVLYALAGQSFEDFEVVICDDGSGERTREELSDVCELLGLRWQYAYHAAEGFQKTVVLNKGLTCAQGEQVVFLDGDCVPHRDFVGNHCALLQPGSYLAGRRVMLGAQVSARLQKDPAYARQLRFATVVGRADRVEEALLLPRPIRRLIGVNRLSGCNWSCWKQDLESINGFNNEARGPVGGEDTNISIRFDQHGLRRDSARFGANVFHQWHPKRTRSYTGERVIVHPRYACETVCANGLAQVARVGPTHL